jgi:hypothetical protein
MIVWVRHGQSFNVRCGVEFAVSTDQYHWIEASASEGTLNRQSSGELNAIIAAEAMTFSKFECQLG